MSLIDRIRNDIVVSLKAHTSEGSVLSTLLSEIQAVGKNALRETTEAEAVSVIQKFIKDNKETIALLAARGVSSAKQLAENTIYERYLPTQLSTEQLQHIIETFVATNGVEKTVKSMGVVMKHLQTSYSGQYDKTAASGIVKQVLAV